MSQEKFSLKLFPMNFETPVQNLEKTPLLLKDTPFKPIFQQINRGLTVIKECNDESESCNKTLGFSIFGKQTCKTCPKPYLNEFNTRKSSCLNMPDFTMTKAKSCDSSQNSLTSNSSLDVEIIQSPKKINENSLSQKTLSNTELSDNQNHDLKASELEIECVIEANYKQRGNFAILKLSKKSAMQMKNELVATPLRPYTTDKILRNASLQGIFIIKQLKKDARELMNNGIIFVANTEKIKKALGIIN